MNNMYRPIIYRLLQVSHQMLITREIYANIVDVTAPQFSILTAVKERPGVHVNEVAEMLNVSGPFVTSEVGKLIKADFLFKKVSDQDRRCTQLHLTESGNVRFDKATSQRLSANETIFNQFRDHELEILSNDLEKLLMGLDAAIYWLETPK